MKQGDNVICNSKANKYFVTKEGTEGKIIDISWDKKDVHIVVLPHGSIYCIDADCLDVVERR